jgi:transposase, IS30 family
MSYTHFTPSERIQLYELRVTEKRSIGAIAQIMNRAKSSISRELKRNTDAASQVYLPDTAQVQMEERRQAAKIRFSGVSPATIDAIKARLQQYHSPEQIAGRLKQEGLPSVSYETIYQMIYADHEGLGTYKQYLRQKRKRRRRKGGKPKRGGIPGRVGIEHRPEVADMKTEIGHWESDTVIGCNHIGVVVTHVDKASKYLLAGLAENKTVQQINQVTMALFEGVKTGFRQTMTFDNGREFCGHQELAEKLGLSTFFANPYHSWERGLNEHTNGLIRQFFPKGTNFKIVKPEALQKVVELINHRPRKSLDYRTPFEVFFASTSELVALQV